MAMYTYDDFKKAAEESGLYESFSDADMKLALRSPDAGMSILKYKKDYGNAQTDDARALANAGAERIRSDYGNYAGGGDGGSFYVNPMSPSSFNAGSVPSYTSKYDKQIQDALGKVTNRQEFSYNAENDPLYGQYKKTYAREGSRATADALGQAAAASGGIPSSYAATAASQAGDYYASKMSDKVPELSTIAYDRYVGNHNMNLGDLSAVQSAERSDYEKYLNQLGQYNADRSFDYGKWTDELAHRRALEEFDYNKSAADRQFQYQSNRDDISDKRYDADKARTQSQSDWEQKYNAAALAAQYGDFSGFKALGYTDAQIKEMRRQWQIQQWR